MNRFHTAARHLRLAARAIKRGLPPQPPRESPAYTERELLERAEEFNRNAELHWRKIASEPSGRTHVLNKPLSTISDTPDILYRLGLVLHALDLGVGMTLLDFGAGSCWLSSLVNRLRCRTISMDVSPTALALGEEMFRTDARHHMELEPQFMQYDGHTIPLEDGSVDRIVCFDSFHHVPNQDAVLREFTRVLRSGGRLVMAEPGPAHSHSHTSVFEAGVHGILENDLPLEELVGRMRRVGFTAVNLMLYPDAGAAMLPAEQYLQFIGGDESVYPIHRVQASLRDFHILIGLKGEPRRDSRNPNTLLAEIEPLSSRLSGCAGDDVALRVRVRNTGDTLWLHEPRQEGGYVRLGAHLASDNGSIMQLGISRATLPHDVAPGGSAEFDVIVRMPGRVGRYRLILDMVDELVTWFEQGGSKVVSTELHVTGYRDSASPHWLASRVSRVGDWPATAVTPGSVIATRIRLENVGDTAWRAGSSGERGAVALGVALLDGGGALLDLDHFRQPLPQVVGPDEVLEVDVRVPGPRDAGPHLLRFDLVAEGVCWFWQMGSEILELPIVGSNEVPDSAAPGRLAARIECAGNATIRGLAQGQASLRLRVTNTGNTRWLASREPRIGHVAIGGNLEDSDGRVIVSDFLRASLPHDVALGETLEFECPVPLPTAGRYRLSLDLVDEGIMWFAGGGPKPLVVTVEVT